MAKMFYSIEEAAQRLKKSVDQVKQMASSGQLQEFRDRDRLMFKREQVDLLSGDVGGGGVDIPLADSKAGSSMGGSSLTLALDDEPDAGKPAAGGGKGAKSGSGAGIDMDEPGQRSGISIFDAADAGTDETDPLAATAITTTGMRGAPGGADAGELTAMESGGSGSGLMELTREADDTSLGADLIEDVYKGDEEGGAGGGPTDTQGASGLFESTTAPSDISSSAMAPAMAMVAAEPYDAVWSGVGGGVALGALLVGGLAFFAVLTGLLNAGDNPIVRTLSENMLAAVGGLVALVAVSGVVGWLLGRKS